MKQQIVVAGAVFFFSEVAVAGVAGAAGVDVLRVDGHRGLLIGKCFFTVSLTAAAVLATMSMLVGKKKIHRHFTLLISHPLSFNAGSS